MDKAVWLVAVQKAIRMRATPSLLSAVVHLQIEVEALAEVRVLARDLRLCERASRDDAAPAAVPERVREAVRRLKAAVPGACEARQLFAAGRTRGPGRREHPNGAGSRKETLADGNNNNNKITHTHSRGGNTPVALGHDAGGR